MKRTAKLKYDEPVDDSTEQSVAEEFRHTPQRFQRIPRRHLLTAEETSLKNCKVRVTTYLDADVLEYFKARAASPDAAGYQTQINNELRRVMERDNGESAKVRKR